MKKLIPLSLICLLFLGVSSTQAQNAKQPWNFGIDIGFQAYNGDLGNELLEYNTNDFTYGISLAHYLNSYFDLALSAKLMKLDRVNGPNDTVFDQRNTSFETDNFNLNLMLRFKPIGSETDLNPYLAVGAGVNFLQFGDGARIKESGTYFGLPFGAGFNFEINDNVALNFEAIYHRTFEDGLDSYPLDADQAAPGVGARQPTGNPRPGADGYPDDGVDHDDFLTTTAGVTFNFGGADKRSDMRERLLRQSMKNLQAAENSSNQASENLRQAQKLNDETMDALNSLSEARNMNNNQENELQSELVNIVNNIQFEFDSSDIIEPAHDELNSLADIMQNYQGLKVNVEGHADKRGSDSYNKDLSQRRAQSVKDYLVDQGVESSRITTNAYGENKSMMSGSSATSYGQNRSVRLTLSYNDNGMMNDHMNDDDSMMDDDDGSMN